MRISTRFGRKWYGVSGLLALLVLAGRASGGEHSATARFENDIQPILIDYCYRCHADGMKKATVAFDHGSSSDLVGKKDLWWNVLKNVRPGLMPPAGKPRPTDKERATPGRLDQARRLCASIPKTPTPAAARFAG